jgi:hypothetical protein
MTDPIEAALAEMESEEGLCYQAGNCGFENQRGPLMAALRVAVFRLKETDSHMELCDVIYGEPCSCGYDKRWAGDEAAILAALRGEE